MSQEHKIPTFWQAVKLLAVGFVTGTACDARRFGYALVEWLDATIEVLTVIFKFVTRWLCILVGPISFPLLAWYVLRIARINEAKRKQQAKEMAERAGMVWGKQE